MDTAMRLIIHKLFTGIFLLAISNVIIGQSPFFSRTLDYNSGRDMAYSIHTVWDGYIISNSFMDSLIYKVGITIIKTDIYGNILWGKSYTDSLSHINNGYQGGFTKRSAGGYYDCGSIWGAPGENSDILLYRFTEDGDTVFTRRMGGTEYDEGAVCREGPDGSIYVAGTTNSFGDPKGDFYLAKLDSSGQVLWQRKYGVYGYSEGIQYMELDSKGNVYMSGFMNMGFSPEHNIIKRARLLKTDTAGNLLWHKIMDNPDPEFMLGTSGYLYMHDDNQIYLSHGVFNEDIVGTLRISKFDSLGNEIFTKEILGLRFGSVLRRFTRSSDGNIVGAGQANMHLAQKPNDGDDGGVIVKFSPDGDSLWARFYIVRPGQFQSFFQDIDTSHFGGYIVVGGYWDQVQDIWLVSTDSLGCIGDGEDCGAVQVTFRDVLQAEPGLSLWPNPSGGLVHLRLPPESGGETFAASVTAQKLNSYVYFTCSSSEEVSFYSPLHSYPATGKPGFTFRRPQMDKVIPDFETCSVEVYALSGKQVYSCTHTDTGDITLDLSFLSPGIYLIRAETGKRVYNGKIVLVR